MEYQHPQQPGVLVDHQAAILCYPEHAAVRVSAGTYVYRALLLVSALFLLATLAVYCSVPELRNLHGRCLLSHVAALLTAYSCNLAAQLPAVYSSMAACQVTGQSPEGGREVRSDHRSVTGGRKEGQVRSQVSHRREVGRSGQVTGQSPQGGREVRSGHRSVTAGR